MPASQILKDALMVVEKDGYWTRGSVAKNGAVCAIGSIGVADSKIGFVYQGGKRIARRFDGTGGATFDEAGLSDDAKRALSYLSASLKLVPKGISSLSHKTRDFFSNQSRVAAWNDDKSYTKKSDVVKAFKRAIKRAERYGH